MVTNRKMHTLPPKTLLLLAFGFACAIGVFALAAARFATPQLDPDTVAVFKLLVVAPMIEEMFFRAVVQAGLRRRQGILGQPLVAIVVTAIAFGAAHLAIAPGFHAVAVMLPALAIGWVYERSRSVSLCVLLHATCNLCWLFGGP